MRRFFISIILNLICISSIEAASQPKPPKPVHGHASIISPNLNLGSGYASFLFKLPKGWGIGQMETGNGGGSFFLFPENMGPGLEMTITEFATEEKAQKALAKIKKPFKKVNSLSDGFEATLSKAWFAGRVNGVHLIEVWYSVPKKTKARTREWNKLKQCVKVDSLLYHLSKNSKEGHPPVITSTQWGHCCHHPDGVLHLLFKNNSFKAEINQDSDRLHLLKFKKAPKPFQVALPWDKPKNPVSGNGFFYIKWDQEELDNPEVYKDFLNEILDDIKDTFPQQSTQFEEIQEFDFDSKNNNMVIWKGSPYSLIAIEADGFLVGFAVSMSTSIKQLSDELIWFHIEDE